MANTNNKVLKVRIRNRYDSYENWASSNLVLEPGEIAIAYTVVTVDTADGSAEQHSELLMKVGNGVNTFKDLPWVSAKAADVSSWAKASTKPTYTVDEIDGIEAYMEGYLAASKEYADRTIASALTFTII